VRRGKERALLISMGYWVEINHSETGRSSPKNKTTGGVKTRLEATELDQTTKSVKAKQWNIGFLVITKLGDWCTKEEDMSRHQGEFR